MIAAITELLAAPVISGFVGMVGGYLNKREELKAIREKNLHEREMAKENRQTAVTISKLKVEEIEVAGKWRTEEQNAKSFGYSQRSKHAISDKIRAVIRPIILAFSGYVLYMNLKATETLVDEAGGLPQDQVIALYQTQVISIISIFTMGCGWYFGERMSKFTDKYLGILK